MPYKPIKEMTAKEALTYLGNMLSPYFWGKEEHREAENKVLQSLDRLEKLEKDLKYLATQKVERFQFPNGREILGIDITNCPSNVERFNNIIQAISKEVL